MERILANKITCRALANEITCDVEVSPGPLRRKRHKRILQGSLTDGALANEIMCDVEVSPGPSSIRDTSPHYVAALQAGAGPVLVSSSARLR